MVWRFFRWQVLRYIAQHRLLTFLNAMSIAVGVAVFLAIQLANASALRAFHAAIDIVAGKAQLEVSAPANDLPDEVFPVIQTTRGVSAATPLVRGFVTLPDFPGEYLDLLGVDIFTNMPFRTFELTNYNARDFDIEEWLRGPNVIAVSENFARQHSLKRRDTIRVQAKGREQQLRIGFVIRDAENAAPNIAAMDIGWAQELLGMRGRLSSVELQTGLRDRNQLIAELRAKLAPNLEVGAPARRSEQIDNMLASFRLNLTAMSLISLFVGAFLIFNTVSASVLRRQREIGILRALGSSRVQICIIFVSEALAAAAAGTLLGLVLGNILAQTLVGSVSETISSLYLLTNVRQVVPSAWSYVAASVLGLFTGLAASIFPAWRGASMAPVGALHPVVTQETKPVIRFWLLIGLVVSLCTILVSWLALHNAPPWLSFVSAFLCLAAVSCVAAPFVVAMSELTAFFLNGRAFTAKLVLTNLQRALARNAVTAAGLTCAIAMAVGVSIMIFSFRETVNTWINQTLIADLFVTTAANEVAGPASFVPLNVIQFFENDPRVLAVDTFRFIEVPFRNERMAIGGIRAQGPRTFAFTEGNHAELMEKFRRERCVIISETFARRQHLRVGQSINIATARGEIALAIAAIFYDYSRDQGLVFTNEKNFAQLFGDDRVNSIGVYLRARASAGVLTDNFQKQLNQKTEFAIYSNSELRRRVFEIFDQTFAITYVLRAIAVIVAIAGIFLSLSTLVLERARIFGVLRAIGLSSYQLKNVVLWEAILIALTASCLGLAAGVGLSIILVQVISRAFFGWTIHLQFPVTLFLSTPLWIIAAAILAALMPALRASRLNLAEVLREE